MLLHSKLAVLFFCLILTTPIASQTEMANQTESPPASEKTLQIENEFLKIIVNKGPDNLGRFAIETTTGDPQNPNDDNQSLIFGRPAPWTSYTTIQVNGKNYVFGGKNKKVRRKTSKSVNFGTVVFQGITEEGLVTICQFDNIHVTQILNFFRNPSTRVKDTVLITYKIENIDKERAHKIGTRIMLDTKLGSNDGAPFRIGEKAVTSEKRFLGKEIFDFWQTFDNLSTPNVVAQGTLNLPDAKVTPPDRLFLVNWGTLSDHTWSFNYKPQRPFIRLGELEKDTALALYWDAQTLGPGETKTIRTLYGLGGVTLAPGQLSLGLTAPGEIYANSQKEILLVGYVVNNGGFDSKNTIVWFNLPQGFTPTDGKTQFNLGLLKAGETAQIPIKVKPDRPSPGIKKIGLTVSSTTLDDNTLARSIECLAPPTLHTELIAPSIKVASYNQYIQATVKVSNKTRFELENITGTLKIDGDATLPVFESAQKEIASLKSGQSDAISWQILVNDTDASAIKLSAQVTSPLTESKQMEEDIKIIFPEPSLTIESSKTHLNVGDYFFVQIKLDNPNHQKELSAAIHFDPKRVKPIRVSPQNWIRQSKQSDKIYLEADAVGIAGIESTKRGFEQNIAKFHFKAIKPGQSNLKLMINNQTKATKSITINKP